MVSLPMASFNVKKHCILLTECIYGFCMISRYIWIQLSGCWTLISDQGISDSIPGHFVQDSWWWWKWCSIWDFSDNLRFSPADHHSSLIHTHVLPPPEMCNILTRQHITSSSVFKLGLHLWPALGCLQNKEPFSFPKEHLVLVMKRSVS
jgi:hypothetical protein